jgi:type II restriction enzyme
MSARKNINDALQILAQLGLPRAQQNERSALCLLALLDLSPGKKWNQAAMALP